LATGVVSVGSVAGALRHSSATLSDKQIPLAGLSAAFLFAAQMVNFPVVAGTTGHLIGGALAAILLGPGVGVLVVSIVVVIQALAFADGGITALGYNVLNLAIVPAYGGYGAFLLFRKVMPKSATGVVSATGLAAGTSVVLAAMAFSIEWLFGATAPIGFDAVFGAMVGVHLLIGIGEAAISAMVVLAILRTRPDMVYGARDLKPSQLTDTGRIGVRTFLVAGLIVTVFTAAIVSQFSASEPDGLEAVAARVGIDSTGSVRSPLFADYAIENIGNEAVSLAVAGLAGVAISLAVATGLAHSLRHARGKDKQSGSPPPEAD
ncbi:MAG: PDGLE domain-containing protein, partial [Acidimicrobiia bacterium]|nr:PDGLE domain-containing protein [Acidimicrobiia bacterium]